MQNKNKYTTKYIICRVFKEHLRPNLKQILFALFFMFTVAICTTIIVWLIGPTTNQFFITKNKKMLFVLSIVMVLLSIIKGLSEYGQGYFVRYIGQEILTSLQIALYDNLLKIDIPYIQQKSSGRLISHFTNDIILMRTAVSSFLVGTTKHLLSVTFVMLLMIYQQPLLSMVVFLIFPIVLFPIQILSKKLRKNIDYTQTLLANYTAQLDETFQSIKIIKSFVTESYEIEKATNKSKQIFQYYCRSAKLDSLIGPIMEIFSGIAIGGLIWYGGYLIISNKVNPGSLISFLAAFVAMYRPFKSLMSLNNQLQEGITAAKRLFPIIDKIPIIRDNKTATDIIINSPPQIKFENVTLTINSTTILNCINFIIEPQSIVAIVGKSGSGKTSIINLLSRFIQITSGNIYINNININDITLDSLRKNISLIPQDTIIFDNDVFNNINYGINEPSTDAIIESAKQASAHEFIKKLPQKYETNLGTQGMILSGGQRQRIAIARAFLKKAPILILDEATSSLDARSEIKIQKSLKSMIQTKTILIITHKLSTITTASKILVFKNGSLIEEGKHEDLLLNKGEYYNLFTSNYFDKND